MKYSKAVENKILIFNTGTLHRAITSIGSPIRYIINLNYYEIKCIYNYFNTTIWSEQKPESCKIFKKASNKYIKEAKSREKKYIKEYGDFGRSFHSTPLTADNDFLDFRNYIGQKSWEYLDHPRL